MKYLLTILCIVSLFSCKRNTDLNKYISELPDSLIINDVLNSIIVIDSFSKDYKIIEKIDIPHLYNIPHWNIDSFPPPPPPPESISYFDLFYFFQDKDFNQKRIDDSVFFNLQADTSRHFLVSKNLVSQFDKESYRYYEFTTPIFPFDKKSVVVKYWRVCGGLCGNCRIVLLQKKNNKWVKIDSWGYGKM